MSTKNVVIDLLNSLIDGVNDVTGKQDTNLTDGVNSLIEGYGQGDGGGLENGYDIMFYDEDGEELAFYSVKDGEYVNRPVYQVKSWHTEDGTAVKFPYKPTTDSALYANTDTYVCTVYKHYNVDVIEYPYVCIFYNTYSGQLYLYFAKEYDGNGTMNQVSTFYTTNGQHITGIDPTDIPAILEGVFTAFNKDTFDLNNASYSASLYLNGSSGSTFHKYINFEYNVASNTTYYRLDDIDEDISLFEGLENGHDVTFYDENNEELAFFSIKEGETINPPSYIVKAWQMEDGTSVTFPYTPTGDIVLYANNDTLAKVLYDHFKVDKNEYPYLIIQHTGSVYTFFAKSCAFSDNRLDLYTVQYNTIYSSPSSNDMESIVNYVVNNAKTLTYKNSYGVIGYDTSYQLSNFDCGLKGTNYRLDDPEEETPESGGGGSATFNIAYGDTEPSDTSMLWCKCDEPSSVMARAKVDGVESLGLCDTHLPTAASSIASAAVGSNVYLFGVGRVNTVNVFNTETKAISTLSTTLPTAGSYSTSAAVGTKVYLFGGNDGSSYLNTINVLDTITGTINTLSATLPISLREMASATVGTKVYLFGGNDGSNPVNTIYVFDTEKETITKLSTTLSVATRSLTSAAVGTKVYLFGGYAKSGGYQNTISIFDTETETITKLSTVLPVRNTSMASATVGTKVYLFGGTQQGSGTKNIDLFDTETKTITTLSITLPKNAYSIASATVGNKVYLFGGWDGSAAMNTIQIFSVAFELEKNTLLLEKSFTNNIFEIVDGIEMGVKNVYIGNSDGVGELVEAYLYKNDAWTAL